MFGKCRACKEKEEIIKLLKDQNAELFDRVMAFTKDAFITYQAEKKTGEPLYPIGTDEKGEKFSYKDLNVKQAEQDVLNALGEEPVEVEDKK